jgi:mono/diheme cytochrome c family protein
MHDMANQPSPAVGQGPRPAAVGSIPTAEGGPLDRDAGEQVTNPVAANASAVANGRALYSIYCTPCHGASGSGRDAAVAKFFPRVGDLTSADVQQHGDGWIYATIAAGTQAMPAYGHELSSAERWQVVAFVRTLRR